MPEAVAGLMRESLLVARFRRIILSWAADTELSLLEGNEINAQKSSSRIEAMVEVEAGSHLDDIRAFMEALIKRQSDSDRAAIFYLLGIGLTWIIVYGIGMGLINEGQLATFKLEKVQTL